MIMEMLDAFGIPTAGAPGYEADDVLGTLAAAERRDPVVVVSGDRDLLQLVRDDPVKVRVLYLGRGLAKATMFGPAEVAETLRRSGRPGRAGLRRTGAVAGRSVRRPARRPRRRREDGGHAAGASTAHWSASWPPPMTRNRRCPRRIGRSCWRPPTTSRPPGPVVRVATDAAGHAVHAVRHAAAGRRAPAKGRRAGRAVRRDVLDRPAAEGARRAADRELTVTWAGPPHRCRCRPGTSPSPGAWCRRC